MTKAKRAAWKSQTHIKWSADGTMLAENWAKFRNCAGTSSAAEDKAWRRKTPRNVEAYAAALGIDVDDAKARINAQWQRLNDRGIFERTSTAAQIVMAEVREFAAAA